MFCGNSWLQVWAPSSINNPSKQLSGFSYVNYFHYRGLIKKDALGVDWVHKHVNLLRAFSTTFQTQH